MNTLETGQFTLEAAALSCLLPEGGFSLLGRRLSGGKLPAKFGGVLLALDAQAFEFGRDFAETALELISLLAGLRRPLGFLFAGGLRALRGRFGVVEFSGSFLRLLLSPTVLLQLLFEFEFLGGEMAYLRVARLAAFGLLLKGGSGASGFRLECRDAGLQLVAMLFGFLSGFVTGGDFGGHRLQLLLERLVGAAQQ